MKIYSLPLSMVLTMTLATAAAQTTSPVVDTAPGEEKTYKADFMAAHSIKLLDKAQHIDEVCYRINFDGDKAYIYNLFSVGDKLQKYVTASVKDGKIYIPTGFVYKDQGHAQGIATRFVKGADGTWAADTTHQPVVWTIDADGTISDEDPNVQIGVIVHYPDDSSMDYEECLFDNFVLQPYTISDQLPEGATLQQYRRYVLYTMEDNAYANVVINSARKGNDFYFKNLFDDKKSMVRSCWIKGTFANGKISIPSDQLIGVDERGYFCYNHKTSLDMTTGKFNVINDPVVLNYDEATGKITTEDWLLSTQGHNEPYLYFQTPELTTFTAVAATPAKPVFKMYSDEWFSYDGTTSLVVLLPYFDVDGNFIDPDNISFSVMLDSDEPYEFQPGTYTDLTQPQSEFPFSFNGSTIVNSSSEGYQRHIINFKTNDYSRVGVQSYYTVDGERRSSEILWYERNASCVNGIENQKQVERIATYDVAGRAVAADAHGVVIKRITYTDGTVTTVKELNR